MSVTPVNDFISNEFKGINVSRNKNLEDRVSFTNYIQLIVVNTLS